MKFAVITHTDGAAWLRCYVDGVMVYEAALSDRELAALIRDAAKALDPAVSMWY